MSVEQGTFRIPSNPADKKAIRDVLQTISDSYTRIEAEKDLIKEEICGLAEQFELPKKLLNKMARAYHKQNFRETVDEADDFQNLYENIVELPNE